MIHSNIKFEKAVISTDNEESIMYRAIQEGVALYLVKPFFQNDLKNIWQFSITTKSQSKPNPSLTIEETISTNYGEGKLQAFETHSVSGSNEVISSERKKKKSSIEKDQEKSNGKKEVKSTRKKPKVVWTDFLQYRFLQAVHFIGLDSKNIISMCIILFFYSFQMCVVSKRF